jgi:murein hydrolase activator
MTRLRAVLITGLCLLNSAGIAASGGSLAQRYQRSLHALDESRASEDKTRVERDRIAAQAKELQEQLVSVAAKVQEIELAYAGTETELDMLNERLRRLEAEMDRDRGRVAQLLVLLQRLDADTPPALAVRPDDSLAAVRGAMQLGAMLPPVYEQAAALAKRLKDLEEARNTVAAKVAEGEAQEEALRRARTELDRLLQLRNEEQAAAGLKLSELHEITEEISKSSTDLKGLIARIATLREGPSSAPGMRLVTSANRAPKPLGKNSLRLPVVGKIEPGDPAGPGPATVSVGPRGLWFEGAPGAEAVAPSDSEVVFAGPYQKFGQVLILEIMGGYHLTLAGLGRIDVRIGDQVLAGEPLGVLSQEMPARLYLEMRRNGQTVDPAPWMGAELRKAKRT